MRYLLMALGALAMIGGLAALWPMNPFPELQLNSLLVQAGAIFLAMGLATFDIVAAIKENQK